ncbi:MAG: tetratricopeptide repeat protein [Candidatus Promineifilaceae bacterium]|nr:tetratricopeptide repeat protein [Candidatus Promineifilaceae bacterium]
MDLKLQQAIVATRAGRTDVAQNLLAQLISENPDEANAWFLLGHLVDSKDRQIRYLQRSLELDPGNEIARKQIVQLTAPSVPAPVLAEDEAEIMAWGSEVDRISPNPEATIPAAPEAVSVEANGQIVPNENLDDRQSIETKTIISNKTASNKGDEWPNKTSGPKRESKASTGKAKIVHIPQDPSQAVSANDRTPEEVWLLRILAIMVVIAVIVLAVLVLLILF